MASVEIRCAAQRSALARLAQSPSLPSGRRTSCYNFVVPEFIELTGRTVGRLTVIRRYGHTSWGEVAWLCLCQCGRETTVAGKGLRKATTRSCGCLANELTAVRSTKHGATARGEWSSEYMSWVAMKDRCFNAHHRQYADYGGRGITVCDAWRQSFATFLANMGPKPTPAHTIDRIDPDGSYVPGNCRWATRAVQNANQRRHIRAPARARGIAASRPL